MVRYHRTMNADKAAALRRERSRVQANADHRICGTLMGTAEDGVTPFVCWLAANHAGVHLGEHLTAAPNPLTPKPTRAR
jgi:hypothetical protein